MFENLVRRPDLVVPPSMLSREPPFIMAPCSRSPGGGSFHGGKMTKRIIKRKGRKIDSPCSKCGQEIETVWMKDGSVRAVNPEKIRALFSNMAQADGREIVVWEPHHPCDGGKND